MTTRSTRIPAAPNCTDTFSTNDRRAATAKKSPDPSLGTGRRSDRISSSSIGRFPSSSARWIALALGRSVTGSVIGRRNVSAGGSVTTAPGRGIPGSASRSAFESTAASPGVPKGSVHGTETAAAIRGACVDSSRATAQIRSREMVIPIVCMAPCQKNWNSPFGAANVPTILRLTFFAFFDSISKSMPTRPSNGFCILK
ncbi:MAG: hypothetical protein H6Q79_1516 [Deltaproteobacteria bacterium]|nr:hypothetical protein [Deltaproteobacteria bacterium]